jgi:hypothetical protein
MILPNIQVVWMNKWRHACYKCTWPWHETNFFPKTKCFYYGTNGLCEGSVWGSNQLEDRFTFPKGNVPAYRSSKFVVANPLTCPKNVLIPIRVSQVHKAQPWLLLKPTLVIPFFSFQLISFILIVLEWITPSSFRIQVEWLNCLVPFGNKFLFNHHWAWTTTWMWNSWMLWFR